MVSRGKWSYRIFSLATNKIACKDNEYHPFIKNSVVGGNASSAKHLLILQK
jgi:hypothetical protein